jgi:transcriptional regulator with GAF, ATPase, and Fis domain
MRMEIHRSSIIEENRPLLETHGPVVEAGEETVASFDLTVIILGETGKGKQLMARVRCIGDRYALSEP